MLVWGVRCYRLWSTNQLLWPAVRSLRRGLSANPGVTMWCVCGCNWRDGVWMLQRGHSGDGCVLASTLCKYDLRKGDLFVLSWARVRRVRRVGLSSDSPCGGGVRSILLLPLVAMCLETTDVCIWCMPASMSAAVIVCF